MISHVCLSHLGEDRPQDSHQGFKNAESLELNIERTKPWFPLLDSRVIISGNSALALVCFHALLKATWVSLTLFLAIWWTLSMLNALLHTMISSHRNIILSHIVEAAEILQCK